MKLWTRVLAGGTLLVAAAVAGATIAGAAPSGGSAQTPAATAVKAVPNAAVDTAVENKFTPVNPCRVVDTRLAGGPIGTRAFYAAGTTGFVTQGGTSGGCGIPSAATAIQATVIAVAPTAGGYLQTWAYGAPLPTNSLSNYQPGVLISTGAVLPINGPAAKSFFLRANGGATQVVVDVTGYFIKPMWAEIGSTATVVRGSRVVSTTKIGTGTYQVDFDRNVSNCSYAATSYFFGITIQVQPRSGDANGVFVLVSNTAGTVIDTQFYLTVTC